MADTEQIPGPEAIAAFWRWWDGVRGEISTALLDDRAETFVEPLRDRLGTLHGELRFSVHAGLQAAHALSISGSTPQSDDIAHTVLDAAPPGDEQWEYSGLAIPVADPAGMTCVVGDLEIEMSGARVAADHHPELGAVLVRFFHPVLNGLSTDLVDDVVNSALSAVTGRVGPSTRILPAHVEQEPENSLDLSELRLYLDRLG